MLRPFTPLYEADDANPQGGSGADDARKVRPSDLVDKYSGDVLKMAEKLADVLNDNHSYREQNRQLKASQTPQGAVVLTGDDAAAWQQYQELGKASDLKQRITDAEAAQQRLAALEREATITKAASASGYKASVLSQLPNLPPVTVKDVTADGKTQPQAFVTTEQGEQPLTAYVDAQYADFLPALRASEQGSPGTPWPRQAANDHGSPPRTAGQIHKANTRFSIPGAK